MTDRTRVPKNTYPVRTEHVATGVDPERRDGWAAREKNFKIMNINELINAFVA